MKKLLFLLLLFISGSSLAQRPTDIWYFGRNAGLDFRNGEPFVLHDGKIDTVEGCTVISDDEGELLFYSDGMKVYNKEHRLMDNGSGLHGHFSSSQSAIIVPFPGNNHLYYIFTVDTPHKENADSYPDPDPDPAFYGWPDEIISIDDGFNNGLNYSIVDMNANGGLGKVISKNQHLITYDPANEEDVKYKASEKLTALYNENEDIYWVISHFKDTFYAFKVNSGGIGSTPVTSTMNFTQSPAGYEPNALGVLKFSPGGTKLAMANFSNNDDSELGMGNAFLLDFDPLTGTVTNPLQLLDVDNPYGVEFSPDGSKLFFSVQDFDSFTSKIYRFDLNASDIRASGENTYNIGMAGALQLASDGKIYMAMADMETISRINNPNTSFDIEWYAIPTLDFLQFFRRQSRYGLPSFIQTYFEQGITFKNLCLGSETDFNLINYTNVASVKWNFGDPASGAVNTSTEFYPKHTYSAPGEYEVSAVVKSNSGIERTETRKVVIMSLPVAFPVKDLFGCENLNDGYTGYGAIPTGHIEAEVLGGQENMLVTYFDRFGGAMLAPLDDPMQNMIPHQDFIFVRVAHESNPTCYAETKVNIFVQEGAQAFPVENIFACDNDGDGFSQFDLKEVAATVAGNQANTNVLLFDEDGNPVVLTSSGSFTNTIRNLQTITARVFITGAECYSETKFDLLVTEGPLAHPLQDLIGCDDNNDGISEYFDVSGVEAEVLQGQTGLQVSYFRSDGLEITGWTSQYTNLQPYEETILVRVGNPQTGCYSETPLTLKTSAAPVLNTPVDSYSCDEGNGFGNFNTSAWTQNIIGNQTGLKVTYYNQNGNPLPTPLPAVYQNAVANAERITAKVENEMNSLCASETGFELIINKKQGLVLEDSYNLCDLEPFLKLKPGGSFHTWEWKDTHGTIISNTAEASLTAAGNYTVTVSNTENGVTCESSHTVRLIRSQLPAITEVKYQEWSSRNYIEIIAGGDADLEYSIDGVNFQDSNYFPDIPGGAYTVLARDINGCGMATYEVVILDYPKFFSPNNDGHNDFWQIKGLSTHPETNVFIFDRYGKLLKQMSSKSHGWDGTFNGKIMPADDYWFTINLEDGREFKNHFSLVR